MKRRQSIAVIKKRETENWIYSYADLITNLMTLFVMLLIVNTGTQKSRKDFQKGLEDYAHMTKDNPKLAGSGATSTDDLKQLISNLINDAGLASRVSLSKTRTGIELTFEGALVFESGTAVINEEAGNILGQIAMLIKQLPSQYTLDVEGHADNRPVSSGRYPSNWELSSARAGSVVRYLESAGIPSRRMRAIGFGSTQPVAEDGEDLVNRRVVVKINSESGKD